MAYIGNDVRSNEDYKIIDDISSGFNGSTTSFALQVGGATPVPFPKFEQQLLISVNGVIQEPDPTGSAGFKLLGTNIVFSSAPTNGHAFFGVIYAGADYVNAGGTFPDGSINFPSITFSEDTNTGFTRTASGTIAVISDGTKVAQFPTSQGSNGQVLVTDGGGTLSYSSTITSPIVSGDLTIPDKIVHTGDTNTAIRFPADDTFSVETAGTEKLRIDSGGHISIGTATSRAIGGSVERKLQVEATSADAGVAITRNSANAVGPFLSFGKSRSSSVGGTTVVQSGDQLGQINFSGADGSDIVSNAASIRALVDGTPGSNDMPGRLEFSTTADGAATPTERMRIDSSGNVGIGTASPAYNLDLSNSSGEAQLRIDSSAGSHGMIRFSQGGTNKSYIQHVNGNHLAFGPGGSEKVRINSSGQVGIGTTAPAVNNKLHLRLADASLASTSSASTLLVENNGDTWITIGSNASNYGGILFADSGSADIGQIRYLHTDNRMEFHTNASERMRIDSSGNVGIGDTNPDSGKLHISSSTGTIGYFESTQASVNAANIVGNSTQTNSSANLILQINGGTAAQLLLRLNGDNSIAFHNGATPTEKMRLDQNGNLGIGTTSPSQKLEVSGNLKVTSGLALLDNDQRVQWGSSNVAFIEGNDNEKLVFGVASERMRIDSSGNVGIGETSAETLLHIKGTDTAYSGSLAVGAIFQAEDAQGRKVQLVAPGTLGSAGVGTPTNHTFTIFTGNNERIRVDTSGNVGIGTAIPDGNRLKVQLSDDNADGFLVAGGSSQLRTNLKLIAPNTNSSGFTAFLLLNSSASAVGSFSMQNSSDNLMISSGIQGGHMLFRTNSSANNLGQIERMRIDSDGDVLVGLTSALSTQAGSIQAAGPIIAKSYINSHTSNATVLEYISNISRIRAYGGTSGSGQIAFNTGGGGDATDSEAMRIRENGKVCIGTTTVLHSAMLNVRGEGVTCISTDANLTSNFTHLIFNNPNGNVGDIRTSGSSTTFTTNSDYRLKENVVAISDGITRLKTLKPYRFNFKADASTTLDGFLAHETQQVVPEAITGTKDEVVTQAMIDAGKYEEEALNDPIYQGIDQSKIVPLLTAALQEAIAKIETLETKVAVLESA